MCPDTVRHDDSPSGSDGPREGHPRRLAGFGGRSILVASLLGFRSPRTQRPLVHGDSGEERTVTHVPGQKCHPCSRLHSDDGLELFPGIPDVIGPNYRLCDVAAVFGRPVQSLRAQALRGEFPRLFRLSRNDWRVEKDELARWAAEQWQCEGMPQLRAQAVRSSIRQPAWRRRMP